MNMIFRREPPLTPQELSLLSENERTDQIILESSATINEMKSVIRQSRHLAQQQSALTAALIRAAKAIGITEDELGAENALD